MIDPVYNWQRYWVPRDGGFSFDLQGFLLPPPSEAEWAKHWKTDVVRFDDILHKPCLVLLGEPGIGKSRAIHGLKKRMEVGQAKNGPKLLFRDLSGYTSDRYLVEDLFQSPEFTAWRNDGGELHVLLDSFDECLLRVDAVAEILDAQFARLPSAQKLFLRITSRTAEWRTRLEDALRDRWGNDSLGVFELAPLTRDQVAHAAKVQQVDAKEFIDAVVESEVVPFAIKPLTLKLLFNSWKRRGGEFPPTQREIYEEGCLELCRDSEKRQTPMLRGRYSAEQRLAVATHIAAATYFCNRAAIWTGGSLSDKPESDLSVSEIATGHVTANGRRLPIDELAVNEALDTGLFTSRGRNRLGWAHQTYGEFLAARYVARESLTDQQVLDLVSHPQDSDRKLVPQLQEVAAWVATQGSALFTHLARVQPEVLLRSDVATADARIKVLLVDSLMAAFAEDTIQIDLRTIRNRYRKLKHPQLSKQLRRVLSDSTYPADARVEAASIAESCELSELLPLFADLALTNQEEPKVRRWAASIVARSSDTQLKKRLRPLALGQSGTDRRQELRGAGLTACWPEHMSVDELFSSLIEPDEWVHGLYHTFLNDKLVQNMAPRDYVKALEWAELQPEQHRPFDGAYTGLVMRILDGAIEQVGEPGVLPALARALLSRLRKHDFVHGTKSSRLIEVLQARLDLRLIIVDSMIQNFQDDRADAFMITLGGLRLASNKDVPTLVARLKSAVSPTIQRRYAQLVSRVFHPDEASTIDAVIETAKACPVLEEASPQWLKPLVLNSNEAREAQDLWLAEQGRGERIKKRLQPKPLTPPPGERLIGLLDEFERGDLSAWWKLYLWLEVKEDGNWCDKHEQMDIRELVGWQNASEGTKARLISAAERYLIHCDVKPDEWFSRRSIIYRPGVAGIRALLLLANQKPTSYETLPREVWLRWMPAILRIRHYDDLGAHRLLTARAFGLVPIEASEWTLRVIEEENKESDHLWILLKLPDKWGAVLGSLLLQYLRNATLKPSCSEQLLTALLEKQVPGALNFARSQIPHRVPVKGNRRRLVLHGARLVMRHGDQSDWSRIWKLVAANSTFGMALMEGFAHESRHSISDLLRTLTEVDIGRLWEWMMVQYPIEKDPDRSRGGEVTIRYAMADLRDRLVTYLAETGTAAGCVELRRLVLRHPHLHWLRRVLLRGQEQLRRLTWEPLAPALLFQMAQNNSARFVQSGGQLLDVILESLEILKLRLQGESLLARYLWNEDEHKPEEDLSEWIKIHLEDDLKGRSVVLGREVQIHRSERTDIHITAMTKDFRTDSFGSAKVIIEVKGDWHSELHTAMETQLANCYLQNNDCQHGLYLVGWFRRVNRRRPTEREPLRKLEEQLATQAKSLTSGERVIRSVVLDCSVPVALPKRSKPLR